MALVKLFFTLILSLWLPPLLCAEDPVPELAIGTPVVVVVGEFIPTQLTPASSGYTRPFVVHPGKRGVVVGLDSARKDLVIVQWEEQYWQEWSEPTPEGYVDTNIFFMRQTGRWIKWKAFVSTINIENLMRPLSPSFGQTHYKNGGVHSVGQKKAGHEHQNID